VILDLLAQGVRQAGEPADVHPHGQVLPFHVGRADVLRGVPTMSCGMHPRHRAGL
jgi:hypothetical protein